MSDFFERCRGALAATEPEEKFTLVESLHASGPDWPFGKSDESPADLLEPGHPSRPRLVHPRELEQRKLNSPEGRAVFIHAIAHIEFNAVNLALDAAYRFRDLPRAYYRDWIDVACDEVRHYRLLVGRLGELGFAYGDFPAHNGLWDVAVKTRHDVLSRMALVPCVLEARGLDVTPPMIEKLNRVGDEASADILALILAEEIGHVATGSRWYRYVCDQRGVDPETTFANLVKDFLPGRRNGPFNHEAREAAGLSPAMTGA